MEEIRIYHSPWRMLLLIVASLAFAVAGFSVAIHSTKGIGSISTKYFARPDATAVDERYLRPDVEIDLEDKDAAWSYIVKKFGA